MLESQTRVEAQYLVEGTCLSIRERYRESAPHGKLLRTYMYSLSPTLSLHSPKRNPIECFASSSSSAPKPICVLVEPVCQCVWSRAYTWPNALARSSSNFA